MKNASKTMYRIGNIFTYIFLGLGALLFIIGLICVITGDAAVKAAGGSCLGAGIYLLVTSILCLVFVSKAQKELEDESKENKTPFIITIVFGAIADNVFYVLAGIFGLIAESQQGQQQKAEEEKAE